MGSLRLEKSWRVEGLDEKTKLALHRGHAAKLPANTRALEEVETLQHRKARWNARDALVLSNVTKSFMVERQAALGGCPGTCRWRKSRVGISQSIVGSAAGWCAGKMRSWSFPNLRSLTLAFRWLMWTLVPFKVISPLKYWLLVYYCCTIKTILCPKKLTV